MNRRDRRAWLRSVKRDPRTTSDELLVANVLARRADSDDVVTIVDDEEDGQ
ncbi:hypothetical protein [Rarobacter incanus]|uniref:hypothetical protein n=1 Tax=Rarobacter incanus TaxID=153494 RepID=UPI0014775781|nr:hypothetical protein [Rarobacter incanus]